MNERVPHHLGAETMAALLDGTLAPRELTATTAHLRDCADCRTILGEMARFEREETATAAAPAPAPKWRLRLIAAAVAAAALLVPATRYVQQRTSPLGTLIAAAPREHRPIAARIAGYPYAPPPVAERGPGMSAEELKLRGAAGEVLERTAPLDTAEARHAAGVAHLLIDQLPQSVGLLDGAAKRSGDARVWNDLAAALHAVGEERSYPDALAAVQNAIRLDPSLTEAHFNRALILEALGRAEAVDAWKRYLELDPSSAWSNEAREHLARLTKERADFRNALQLAQRDPSTIPACVRAFPQDARRYSDVLLAEWADAEVANDGSAAAKLALVRAIGQQLVTVNGEALLADTVAAIDRSSGTQRRALAEAHRLYREARMTYSPGKFEDAQTPMARAESALRAAGSPMADVAAHFAAMLLSDLNRGDEAAPTLRVLLARIDAQRHPALAAEIRATLANCATAAAEWSTAEREASLACAEFERLGETENAAFVAASAAHALDRAGKPAQAWKQWVRAFTGTRHDPRKHDAVLHAAAVALSATDRHAAAQAMTELFGGHAEREPVTVAAAFTEVARASNDATRSLEEARAAAQRIRSEEARALAVAQLNVAEGMQRRSHDPRAAVASIGDAIRYFAAWKRRIDLADAHLQRGRAWRAAGDDAAALADYDAAMQQVEQQRRAIGPEKNLEFLDTAAQIIDETIELQLDRRNGREAFELADRAHALLDKTSTAAIPERTAVLEYVLLPQRVAIFCLTNRGLTTVTVDLGRRDIANAIDKLGESIRERRSEEQIRADARSLHRVLIAPVQSELANVDELVLVPDRELHALPFAVLFDGERHLIERYTIRYSPSAAAAPKPLREDLAPAVVIADPDVDGWPALPYSRDEAEEVGAILGAELLTGTAATRAQFLAALQRNAIVHYAGHADSSAGSHGTLVLTSGLLTARDIARLSLHERSPLVVLSACGTLRGNDQHIAGSPTLGRAFLTAGARAVVGTQWEVKDDLTRALFVHFHQELRAGQAPARALRTAQIAILQSSDPRFRHPATWSAVAVLSNL